MKIVPNFKLWLEADGKPVLGDGRAELLMEIDKCGSLTKAAKNLNISYRHAYKLIEDLNQRCGQPVIVTSIGGTDGGGMQITEFGRNLVKEFANIRKEIANYINEQYENRNP